MSYSTLSMRPDQTAGRHMRGDPVWAVNRQAEVIVLSPLKSRKIVSVSTRTWSWGTYKASTLT